MKTIYDSAWVPVASGTINAAVSTGDYSAVRFFICSSGSNNNGTTTAGWTAGGLTPIPWNKNTPDYRVTPPVTGTYTVAAPTTNTTNTYVVGVLVSGTVQVGPIVPSTLYISTVAGASSWARVIVEGK